MRAFSTLIVLFIFIFFTCCRSKVSKNKFSKVSPVNHVVDANGSSEVYPGSSIDYDSPMYFIISLVGFCFIIIPLFFYILNKRANKFYIK